MKQPSASTAKPNHFPIQMDCVSVDLLIIWHLYDLYSIYLYLLYNFNNDIELEVKSI